MKFGTPCICVHVARRCTVYHRLRFPPVESVSAARLLTNSDSRYHGSLSHLTHRWSIVTWSLRSPGHCHDRLDLNDSVRFVGQLKAYRRRHDHSRRRRDGAEGGGRENYLAPRRFGPLARPSYGRNVDFSRFQGNRRPRIAGLWSADNYCCNVFIVARDSPATTPVGRDAQRYAIRHSSNCLYNRAIFLRK